jgi:hypothetical protein
LNGRTSAFSFRRCRVRSLLVAALLVQAVVTVPRPERGVMLLALVAGACSVNATVASREQAFNLRRYEARYRLAGRYLETALSPDAVVIAVQQSGSVRQYAHTPTSAGTW